MLFDDSLHGLHHQGCESYGPEVIQSVYGGFLWNGEYGGEFPQLGDCAGVHRPLKQYWKNSPQLLSTEPQVTAADVVWARGAVDPCPPEGSHNCFKGECGVS